MLAGLLVIVALRSRWREAAGHGETKVEGVEVEDEVTFIYVHFAILSLLKTFSHVFSHCSFLVQIVVRQCKKKSQYCNTRQRRFAHVM